MVNDFPLAKPRKASSPSADATSPSMSRWTSPMKYRYCCKEKSIIIIIIINENLSKKLWLHVMCTFSCPDHISKSSAGVKMPRVMTLMCLTASVMGASHNQLTLFSYTFLPIRVCACARSGENTCMSGLCTKLVNKWDLRCHINTSYDLDSASRFSYSYRLYYSHF